MDGFAHAFLPPDRDFAKVIALVALLDDFETVARVRRTSMGKSTSAAQRRVASKARMPTLKA